jgi:hypothetical protein
VFLICESAAAGVAGRLIAAPNQSAQASGGDAVAIVIKAVALSACVGFAVARTDLARRRMVVTAAVVPLAGLIGYGRTVLTTPPSGTGISSCGA